MIKRWTVVFLLILTLFQGAHADEGISGSAQVSWRSTSTTTENQKKKSWGLSQTYNIGLRKEFTSKVSFATDVGINTTETNDTKTTRLFPKFRLNVANEYFDANGGYQLNEQGLDIFGMVSDENRFTTETWTANLATKSVRYPKIRFRYEEDKAYDHLLIRNTDTLSKLYEATADYTYKILNFMVKRSKDINENFVSDSTQTTTANEGSVEFGKSFWDNRVTSSGSYRWTEKETERVAREKDVKVKVERQSSTAWYGVAGTKTGTPTWIEEDELVDDIKNQTTPSINLKTLYQNVRIDLSSAEDVELIYLWTTAPEAGFDKAQFQWDVYYSNDAVTWTPITATVTFNENEYRFEFPFSKTNAKYFRVVNTQNDSTNLYVAEIEAFGFTTQAAHTTTSTTDTRENIIFNAGLRPVDWMRITYNFTQDEAKTDPGSSTTRQSVHNISARADVELHRHLKAWAQYQTRLEYSSESDRKSTDTYSLHFDSSPLAMLNTSLSLNHSVPKVASVTQSRTTSSLLHIAATLHEGADLSVDGNLNYTENLVNGTETFTRAVDSDLRLKLTKTLTTEIRYTTNWANTHNGDGTETSGWNSIVTTDIYYRPVRSFYFKWSYELQRNEKGEESTVDQYNINWVMTEKLRLNMRYRVDRKSGVRTIYSSDLVWNLSKIFVIRCGYDWSRQEADTVTKTQTFTSTLSAKF